MHNRHPLLNLTGLMMGQRETLLREQITEKMYHNQVVWATELLKLINSMQTGAQGS